MSELLAFMTLGFRHIVALDAMDHILFLLALAAIYRFSDWRETLAVITAFTVGHSITLALAVTDTLTMPAAIVEFLIPVTILITAVENLIVRDRGAAMWGGRYRVAFAGVFGLVHGAGFATYLKSLFVEHVAGPLFGFNVGIEMGQVTVLLGAFVLLHAADRIISTVKLPARAPAPLRLRVIAVSTVIALVAAHWALERAPW
jgi:uncharacterized membrane protein HdeD (DUF308 family)